MITYACICNADCIFFHHWKGDVVECFDIKYLFENDVNFGLCLLPHHLSHPGGCCQEYIKILFSIICIRTKHTSHFCAILKSPVLNWNVKSKYYSFLHFIWRSVLLFKLCNFHSFKIEGYNYCHQFLWCVVSSHSMSTMAPRKMLISYFEKIKFY